MPTNDWQSSNNVFGPAVVLDDGSTGHLGPVTYPKQLVSGYRSTIIRVENIAPSFQDASFDLMWYADVALTELIAEKTFYATPGIAFPFVATFHNWAPWLVVKGQPVSGGTSTGWRLTAQPVDITPEGPTTSQDGSLLHASTWSLAMGQNRLFMEVDYWVGQRQVNVNPSGPGCTLQGKVLTYNGGINDLFYGPMPLVTGPQLIVAAAPFGPVSWTVGSPAGATTGTIYVTAVPAGGL